MAVLGDSIMPLESQLDSINEEEIKGKEAKRTKDTIQYNNEHVRFVDRFSFRTNYINWILGVPNMGIEFDLSAMDYGKWTINIEGQYRPVSNQELKSPWVYNKSAASLEVRRYYRTEYDPNNDKWWSGKRYTLLNYWKHLVRLTRPNARDWRAYYIGPYLEGGMYDFKFSHYGYSGSYLCGGGSLGFDVRLYQINNLALDLELGTKVGILASKSNQFVQDAESNCYRHITSKYEQWHPHFYPIITDLHVSLVLRSSSIKNKYNKKNERWEHHIAEINKLKINRRDSSYQNESVLKEEIDDTSRKRERITNKKSKVFHLKSKDNSQKSDTQGNDSKTAELEVNRSTPQDVSEDTEPTNSDE